MPKSYMPKSHEKGLPLSRAFYESCSDQLLAALPPEVVDVYAAGLVGEGSECFGMDDAYSIDHDWGPAFCLWLPEHVLERWSDVVEKALGALPQEFAGHATRMAPEKRNGRVGPLSIEGFYAPYLRSPQIPQTWREWRLIPEHHYAVCTNGDIFCDNLAAHDDVCPHTGRASASMTTIRTGLLQYYPRDLWLKKIAARCALMAQSGQYNLLRSIKRGDRTTAAICAARFAEQTCLLVHHLARQFAPFYKWIKPSAAHASALGGRIAFQLDTLVTDFVAVGDDTNALHASIEQQVEAVCVACADELRALGLSDATDGWMMEHAQSVQSRIVAPELAGLHIMLE